MKKLDNNNTLDQKEINRLFDCAPSWAEYISFDSDGYQQWHYSKPKHSLDYEYYSQHGIPVSDNIDDAEHHLFASCVVRRPAPPLDFNDYRHDPGFWQRFKIWRQNKKNQKDKISADNVKRLMNWGK